MDSYVLDHALFCSQIIISADVLAGHPGSPGLVCDLLGADGSGWCGNRQLAAGTVAALCIAPLVTPKRLSSTVITRWAAGWVGDPRDTQCRGMC